MSKVLGWLLLLVVGILSLPLVAYVVDGQGAENWILPIQVVVVLALGGLVGVSLPGFVAGSPGHRAAVGAAYGVVGGLVGLVVFFLLLSGLDGA